MFNDGEPEDITYIYGDLSLDTNDNGGVGRKPEHFPVSLRSMRVKTIKGSRRALSKKTQQLFPIGSPAPLISGVSTSVDSNQQQQPVDDDTDSSCYTTIHIPEDHPSGNSVYWRDSNSERIEHDESVPYHKARNLVEVPEDLLDGVQSGSDALSLEVATVLLNESASLMMSYDKASSYAEAALRDGLGVEVSIDSTVLSGISHLARLNILYLYACKMQSLPNDIKSKFFSRLSEKIADDAHADMTREMKTERYSSELENLVARVRSRSGDSPMPKASSARRSRRGATKGYVLTKPEGELSTAELHDSNNKQAAGVRVTRRR